MNDQEILKETNDYKIYYPHPCVKLPLPEDSCEKFQGRLENASVPSLGQGCQTVSIDPAPKNFGIRIEKRFSTNLVLPIFMDRVSFYQGKVSAGGNKINFPQILTKITNYLQWLHGIIKESQVVAIERPLSKNYITTRIYQHLLTYFMIWAPSFTNYCIVIDLSPKLKAKILGAPKNLKYHEQKKWAVEKALEILKERSDQWSIDFIQKYSRQKADDLADSIIQMEAWFRLITKLNSSTKNLAK